MSYMSRASNAEDMSGFPLRQSDAAKPFNNPRHWGTHNYKANYHKEYSGFMLVGITNPHTPNYAETADSQYAGILTRAELDTMLYDKPYPYGR